MLFHMSIVAHDPKRVAAFLAKIWDADLFTFPPVGIENSWAVVARDDRRSCIEVYPIDTVLRQGEGEADVHGEATGIVPAYTAVHALTVSPLAPEKVMELTEAEGWPAKYYKRGGQFGVIEIWIEGRQMMEIMTPEMEAEFRNAVALEAAVERVDA